jgi:hypothetical protein
MRHHIEKSIVSAALIELTLSIRPLSANSRTTVLTEFERLGLSTTDDVRLYYDRIAVLIVSSMTPVTLMVSLLTNQPRSEDKRVPPKHFFSAVIASLCLLYYPCKTGAVLGEDPHQSNNLEDSQKHIHTRTGKKIFQKEIIGHDVPNYGTKLPAGLTIDELATVVFGHNYATAVGSKASIRDGVGVMKFPGQPGLFVGAGAVTNYDQGPGVAPLYVAVFKLDKAHAPEVVARTEQPLSFAGGQEMAKGKALSDDDNVEDHLAAFDRATFQIAPDKYAFGLRLSHQDIYAGGGGEVRYLHLFTVAAGKIHQVFGGLIYDYQLVAGDWNKDHTRQHFTYEDNYTVSIEKTSTAGYNDLSLVQTLGGKQHCQYAFDAKANCYVAKGKEPAVYFAQNKGQ